MKLPSIRSEKIHILLLCLIFANLLLASTVFFLNTYTLQQKIVTSLRASKNSSSILLLTKSEQINSLKAQISKINGSISDLQNSSTAQQVANLQSQIDSINNAFNTYSSLTKLISKAKSDGANTDAFNARLTDIGNLLLASNISQATTNELSLQTDVTNADNQVIAQAAAAAAKANQPTATPTTLTSIPGTSYTTTTVNAAGHSYTTYLLTIDLTIPGLHITTDTAQNSDCTNNCTVYDLRTYYLRDNGFAGINMTYLCPATYSSCTSKTNSFDFPVYNTNIGKWINQGNLFWVQRAMMTFDANNHPIFYPDASTYSVSTPVHAAFVMAPGLVQNGQVIVGNYQLDTKSATANITRGALGIKGNTLMIAYSLGLTVPQMAYVMQSLGATDAINIDGGGSTALMYNGQYMLGPGRGIPNALIFSKN